MALTDHGKIHYKRIKALDLDTNSLKVQTSSLTPLNPIQDELIKLIDSAVSNLQTVIKSFQNIKLSITGNIPEVNKENSPLITSQNSFSFEKFSPIFKRNLSSVQNLKRQLNKAFEVCNEFLKTYCPKASFDPCLDMQNYPEFSSLNSVCKSPLKENNEIRSPTLDFSKVTDRFVSKTSFKPKSEFSIKINGCDVCPDHHLKPPTLQGKLYFGYNVNEESADGKIFEDISPIGNMVNNATFTNEYYRLLNPISHISEFNCETDHHDENEGKTFDRLKKEPEMNNGELEIVDEMSERFKTTQNRIVNDDKEMSTEFSIEIQEVKIDEQKLFVDEDGNEMLLVGLNNDE